MIADLISPHTILPRLPAGLNVCNGSETETGSCLPLRSAPSTILNQRGRIVGMIHHTRRRLGAVLAGTVLSLSPIAIIHAAESKPIKALFEEAVRQVEGELGRGISIRPIVISAQSQSIGFFGLSVVSMTAGQDNAGLKFISADRRDANDVEWKEAVAILIAFAAPDVSVREKQAALAELLDARSRGRGLAKQISNSWIMAGGNPQEGETWLAFQSGVTLNGRKLVQPPPMPSPRQDGR